MSRRDKILFLAISQKQNPKPHVSEPFELSNHQLIPRPSIIIEPTAEKSFDTTFTRHSLKCYETLPSSEEEYDRAVNYFEDSDDSVIDKDYCPEFILSDSDSNSPIRIKRNLLKHKETRRKKTEHEETERVEFDREETEREEIEREKTEHGEIEREETERGEMDREETERGEINCEQTEREETECENSEVEECVIPENEKGLTKAGLPRKRRRFDVSLTDRQRQKKDNADEKLSLKPPCDGKCRKKCTTKISEEIRREIHDQYISLNWESRGVFIKGLVEPKEIKTRTTKGRNKNKRDVSYYYHFQVKHERIDVCKTFFLTTLGYNPQNNRHIHSALSKEVDNQKDKRGSYERKNVIDKDVIKDHIQSFNPTISHYRREHAPNRLYLPSDINVTMMHQCFIDKYPNMPISFETYRKVVKELNISFAHLGHEECEQCALLECHTGCSQENCDLCIQNNKHKLRYTESREEYQQDKEQALTDKDCIYFSVDLQKVIMLPRMDQFKTAIFCPRIITFNESFVPLGGSNGTNVPYAVLWNETVSGRSQEDIISAFRSFFIHERDMKHIVLWADNCAAQNKNWAFMCFLVNIVNSQLIAAESITVKYFEPGHTFMSADNFHHQVEMALKKKKKVYDFDDFVDSVKMANSKRNIVKVMAVSDFYNYEDVSSQHRIRNMEPRVYLKDIMAVRAERGAFTIKHKVSHVSDWKELDFLQVKITKNKCFPNFASKNSPRGITKERKHRIIADLVPLMPETRRGFWLNLPETSQTSNLD